MLLDPITPGAQVLLDASFPALIKATKTVKQVVTDLGRLLILLNEGAQPTSAMMTGRMLQRYYQKVKQLDQRSKKKLEKCGKEWNNTPSSALTPRFLSTST